MIEISGDLEIDEIIAQVYIFYQLQSHNDYDMG